jgi:hypothetical protein
MNFGEITKSHGEPLSDDFANTLYTPCYSIKFYTKKIDEDIALVLIQSDIITLDTGNWETGEQHFKIDYDKMYYSKLGKINFILKNINSGLNKSELVIDELNKLKLIEERKRKIYKIDELNKMKLMESRKRKEKLKNLNNE